MIKIEIANEKRAQEPERTVTFEFRRHRATLPDEQAFLTATETPKRYNPVDVLFPVKVDGRTKRFHVRRSAIEALGFELVIE